MIYRRYHAARAEKLAAEQAQLDKDIAEINGEVAVETTPQQPAPAPQQQPQQQRNHNQKR